MITGPDDLFHLLRFILILLATSGAFISSVGNQETILFVLLCFMVAIVLQLSHGNLNSRTLFMSSDGTIRWQVQENQWAYGNLCPNGWAMSRYAVIGVEQDGQTERLMISRGMQKNNSFKVLLSELNLKRLEG